MGRGDFLSVPTAGGGGGGGDGVGGLAIYGDGSDGTVTIAVDTTLARDMYYENLTVNAGINLSTGGFRIFVRGTLTLNGVIRNNGGNGLADGTAGQAAAEGFLATGDNGGAGGAAAGVVGDNSINSLGGPGGAGGSGSGGAGGGGGTANPPSEGFGGLGGPRAVPNALTGSTVGPVFYEGGAGGGGGGGDGTAGGGGGGGGGCIMISARVWAGSGVVQALGGNGGSPAAGNRGGGGGGGGGWIVGISDGGISGITFDVSGGTMGTGSGTGTNGVNGSVGRTYTLLRNAA